MDVPPDALEGLRKQANRLRFKDAALETAFYDERVATAQLRSRVLLVAGMLAAGGIGYSEAMAGTPRLVEFNQINLQMRFFGMVPAWFMLLLSTYLPGHRQRAAWVNTVGTIVACWALALVYWHVALLFPKTDISNAATGGLLTLLLVSAVALPMSFRALVVASVGAIGGTLALYAATLLPERSSEVRLMSITFVSIGSVVLFLSWYREAADRLMFAQREHMRRLNAELARLNAEKNEFIAIASHDLQSPLASVHGLADQLCNGRLAAPAEAHAAIRDLARRMLQLVEDYLGAHAIESGTLPIELARLDLRVAATQAAARHTPVAAGKDQRITVAAGPAVWVLGDPARLAQVTDNFTSNALKFSPRGATIHLAVAVAEDGSAARLEVTDEGPGIAAEDQGKLFRKFARTGAQPTGGETSHGLGLAVAHRLAESMGGSVGCQSEAGAGATFWIMLPAAR